MTQVVVSRHPLLLHKLARLRDRATDCVAFRHLGREISQILFLEATQDLPLQAVAVRTPLAECEGQRVAERIGIMPVLRAGLGMAEAILDIYPEARVWHLGLYRDHATLQPVTYYNKLPAEPDIDVSILVDPMLATGGPAVAAVAILKPWGPKRTKNLAIIPAPE